ISCSSTGEKKCISFPNEIEFLGSTYKLDKTKNLIQIIGNNLASAAFWVCQELEFQDNSDEFNNTYRLFHESIDISKPSNISHQTTVRMLPVDSFDDHSQAIQGIQ
ncbi:hypothetical protein FPK39_20885, partial [Acinetobacter baumannii]|nr:hypothetical protein [Acinetobacter baumannii]